MVFRVLPIEHVFHSLMSFIFVLILAAKTLVTLSTKDKEEEALQLEANPSASRTSLASVLVELGMIRRQLLHL
jgi:hypothetical protein